MAHSSTQPAWLADGQLRWAWHAWEPLMMFRRVGFQFEAMEANAHWSEDWFKRLHSEEYVKKLADAGFNCITTHFHKGFGMVAEAEEMEMTRQLIELCHRYGIRVFTYVQSVSIMPETFFAEKPEAESWLQIDENGKVRTYGNQYWRVFPCPSRDEFVAYIKKVVEKAVTWAKADGINLDNPNFLVCQCDACQEKFKQYLKQRYPHGDQERFGIPNLDRVRVAVRGSTRDPIVQESIRFRCEAITEFIRDMRAYARKLNPDVAVAANVTVGSPTNFYAVYGNDYSTAPRAADVVIAENGDFPTVEDGVLITQIRYYKLGHTTGAVILPSNWLLTSGDNPRTRMPQRPEEVKLDMAEAAAYGRRLVGATWAGRAIDMGRHGFFERPDIYETVRTYFSFFKEHESLYLGAKSLANVATFRNFPSLAFNYDDVYACLVGYEQVLIQNQVPFEVLFTEDLGRLDEFDVLILPNILCMSEPEMERIRAFAKSGKGLVATGETSLYDENHRQWRDYGLADLFGTSYERYGDNERVFRNGRVIFTPGTPEKVDCNRGGYQTRAPLPEKASDLLAFVREVSPSELPLEVGASPFVTTEICQVGDRVVVHLINHDNSHEVRDIDVRLASRIKVGPTAQLLSVDLGTEERLDLHRDADGRTSVRVPVLETYSLVVF